MVKFFQFILISLMFALPIVGIITTPTDYVVKSENRVISKFPKLGHKNFFADLQKYFSDRILFKISTSEKLYPFFTKYFSGFKFSQAEIAIPGNDGWLFFSDWNLTKVYLQHIMEIHPLPSTANDKIAYLRQLENVSETPVYFVIGPDKHGIYPEYLDPHYGNPGKYRYFDTYKKRFLVNNIRLIDLQDSLLDAKNSSIFEKGSTLYYSDDTHWNKAGAYIAFNKIMKSISNDYKPLNYTFKFDKHKNGDLIKNRPQPETKVLDDCSVYNSSPSDIDVYDAFDNKHKFFYTQDYIFKGFGNKYINRHAKDNRKVLLMSDSFGKDLVGYFSDYFVSVIHIFRVEESTKVIEILNREKPDIIIYVNVERNAEI